MDSWQFVLFCVLVGVVLFQRHMIFEYDAVLHELVLENNALRGDLPPTIVPCFDDDEPIHYDPHYHD
jgi:hypothetical protein